MNNITNVLFHLASDYSLHELMNLDGWPVDAEGEPQSTENVTIVTIREDEIDLLVGGDWQEPKYVTLCLDEDNELQVKDHSDGSPSENPFTYWFVSYRHRNGFGNAIIKLHSNFFLVRRAEKLLDPDPTKGLTIMYYKQITKGEYDLSKD